MDIALRQPTSRDAFLDWADTQDGAWEFDGQAPVGMTGGTAIHSRLQRRLVRVLEDTLAGSPCEAFGPDLGVATVGDAVRFPDALVAGGSTSNPSKLAAGVVVFEVLSPRSGHTDRIVKVREYGAVPTIRRHVIVEQDKVGLTVLERSDGGGWRASILTAGELQMPEIGITLGMAGLYGGLGAPDAG